MRLGFNRRVLAFLGPPTLYALLDRPIGRDCVPVNYMTGYIECQALSRKPSPKGTTVARLKSGASFSI